LEEKKPGPAADPHRRRFVQLTVLAGLGTFCDLLFASLVLAELEMLPAGAESSRPWYFAWLLVLAVALASPLAAADALPGRAGFLIPAGLRAALFAAGAGAFALANHVGAVLVLALVAALDAFASPARQASLLGTLPRQEIARSNGILFLACASAGAAGALAGRVLALRVDRAAGSLAALAVAIVVAILAARWAESARVPGAAERTGPWGGLAEGFRFMARGAPRRRAVAAAAAFWGTGLLFLINLSAYGFLALRLHTQETVALHVSAALGFGVGAVLAGSASRGKIEFGLVPLGAFGIGFFSILLFWTPHLPFTFEVTALVVALLALSGGLFYVPIRAFLQAETEPRKACSSLAAIQLLEAVGAAVGVAVLFLLRGAFRFDPDQVFLLAGVAVAVGTIYALTLLPDHLLRFLFWLGTNLVYKLRVAGAEHIPPRGAALLVANHVSFADGLIILASTPRFIRFVVHRDIADLPTFRRLSRVMRAIPISAEDPPRAVVAALKEAGQALEAGELVCVFAEGQITRTGQILPFRGGVERILKQCPAPVIPAHLDQVWGSIFSFAGGKFFWKLPRRTSYPVTVSFGKPLDPETPVDEIRAAVQVLESEAFQLRKLGQRPLPLAFLSYARRHPFRLSMLDSTGKSASFGKLAAGVVSLARTLREVWKDEESAGILLPPSLAGAAVNIAASLLGKPAVNLNYTSSAEGLRSAVEQTGIKTVVTSKAFLEKVPLDVAAKLVHLEELAGRRRGWRRVLDALAAWFLPFPLLRRYVGGKKMGVDDVATVIFSSGSTGEPKGVMLSHFNILSNIQSVSQVFDLGPHQRILGVLPFFHATGYMGGLWAPLLTGMSIIYHPNPLDARVVGELAKRHRVTILFATPTFIQGYTRRCEPGDFGSVRYVVVGAEKLTPAVAEAFRKHFGIEPMEGYGCTEASPMVAVNVPDFRGPGMFQVGWKPGTVGRPIPGVSVRIVDPETGERCPPGTPGMLLVKGPNLMKGYLGRPDLTAEAIHDGWYRSGDIATVDDDGFLTITDRLSRFAKVAGEMVPLIKVEEALNDALGGEEQVFSVTSVPDEKKGERLVVVHTAAEEKVAEVIDKLPRFDLPNLWTPRREAFIRVEAIPRLGTGKVDLKKVKEIARGGG
jgi:acyl-[acyl-carrier-protein]-phospholipid O-acyltransferase/long-chain-fatty-acid--[acyl-carrier-protein] ligase